jgi:hypothetical protein
MAQKMGGWRAKCDGCRADTLTIVYCVRLAAPSEELKPTAVREQPCQCSATARNRAAPPGALTARAFTTATPDLSRRQHTPTPTHTHTHTQNQSADWFSPRCEAAGVAILSARKILSCDWGYKRALYEVECLCVSLKMLRHAPVSVGRSKWLASSRAFDSYQLRQRCQRSELYKSPVDLRPSQIDL